MTTAPYLTAAQVRSRAARFMDLDATTYPDGDIEALVSEFEEIAEDYRGVAFVVRTTTEIITPTSPTSSLALAWPELGSVTSVTVNGTVVSASLYRVDKPSGIISYNGTFSPQYPATVAYTHGLTAVPERLQRATARYVAHVLQAEGSGVSRDTLSSNFDGGTTRYSTPDKAAGRPTGWLEVDRLLNSLPDYRTPGVA